METFRIRKWTENDIGSLASHLNNRKIWDNCRDSLPYPYTEKDAEEFIRSAEGQEEQGNYCVEIGGEAAGNISFTRGSDVERFSAEAGYWLAEPYWGRGIMTEALKRTICEYLGSTDVVRIYAKVYDGNQASMRVLEKTGFRKYGISRKACFKNGRFVDCHCYELLKEDFFAGKVGRCCTLRQLGEADIPDMRLLFLSAVLEVNSRDYTSEEVHDWASCGDSDVRWKELLSDNHYIGAFDTDGHMSGFTSMNREGHLHSMFVHSDCQGRGVATQLLSEAERLAVEYGVEEITCEVSLTARPFFMKRGYKVVKIQKARANRLMLTNFVMTKQLK